MAAKTSKVDVEYPEGDSSKVEPIDGATFKRQVEFICPFCPGVAAFGETEAGYPAVIHTIPYCKTFEDLDPLEFLTTSRKIFQAESDWKRRGSC